MLQVYLDVGILACEIGAYMHGACRQMQAADEAAVILEVLVVLNLDAAFAGRLDAVYRLVGLVAVGGDPLLGMAAAVGHLADL